MKRLACAFLAATMAAAGLTMTTAAPPDLSRTYTTPWPPPRDVLDRLNLKMAWRNYVPMDGRRDGLSSVQLHGNDLLVQTRSGLVALMDAETGVIRWRTRVGLPYSVEHQLAYNSREVYVINSTYLYSLDRRNGAVAWRFRIHEGVSASPVADDRMLYIASPSGRIAAYVLPRPDLPSALAGGMTSFYDEATTVKKTETEEERRARIVTIVGEYRTTPGPNYLSASVHDPKADEEAGPRPVRVWTDFTSLRLELPILLTSEYLLLPTPNGIVVAYGKVPREGGGAAEIYRFPTESSIRVPSGHYGDMAYVGAEDANLYALEISNGRLGWRYTAGTAISRQPAVTEQDIYVVAERNGMTRLDRATGQPMWRIPVRGGLNENNSAADRFLAANTKYVYAADASNRLLVLDRRRGVTLSGFDFKDFVFPVPNEVTDRLYLAANNGLIVCLHDREYTQPIRHRRSEEEAENPLRIRLGEPITDPGSPKVKLSDLLDNWTRRFPPVKFRIDEAAYKRAELESPAAKNVQVLKVDNKPLGDVLKAVLDQVKSTFEVIGDTIVIVPNVAPPAAP
jgi:outer membrane protein assembly factor BamB